MLLRYWIKIKRVWQDWHKDIVLGLSVFFISLISFSLGYIAAKKENPPQIVISGANVGNAASMLENSSDGGNTQAQGQFVASRNGRYYYLPSCSGVRRINEENKIWFETKEDAEAQGYKPAANCPGININE